MMKVSIVVAAVALLASPALCFDMEVAMKSSLTFDIEAAKNRPVSKVITLLKDMLKQLEKEAEEDEEIYDKMACWCETNDKEKTKSIADAEARISDLTTKIEELTASSARLNTEIKNLEKEVAENQSALDKARPAVQRPPVSGTQGWSRLIAHRKVPVSSSLFGMGGEGAKFQNFTRARVHHFSEKQCGFGAGIVQ